MWSEIIFRLRSLFRRSQLEAELGRRINAIPGVATAAFSSYLPGSATPLHFTLGIEDRPSASNLNLRTQEILVSPDYCGSGLCFPRFFDGGPNVAAGGGS